MTNVELLTNTNQRLLDQLRISTAESDRITFLTAFGSVGGFKLIKNAFDELMSNAGSARFLFDISQGMTSPDLIEEIATFPGEAKVKISASEAGKGFLHSKLYFFEGEKTSLVSGSSNFSIGGLRDNIEASLFVNEPSSQLVDDTKSFIASLWHGKFSIDPTVHLDIFEEYRKMHDEWSKNQFVFKNAKSIESLTQKIKNINIDEEYENNNLDLIYLMGLLAANIKYQNLDNINQGILEFRYRSQQHNSSEPAEQGYITNIIDGERLGNIRLPQFQTMLKYIKGIEQKILEFLSIHDPNVSIEFEDKTQININFIIKVKFSKSNKVYETLKKYYEFCVSKSPKGAVCPILPSNISKIEKKIGIHFVQGYIDFRSRLSQADRVSQKLRIGVQIDKGATRFLYEFADYLRQTHNLEVNVNDGSARGKDNMLRITASKETNMLFNSTWQKQMNAEFASFNSR